MAGYEITAATPEHLEAIVELARHLDTVNLPDDRGELRALLECSERSYARDIADPSRRQYVLLLRDVSTGRAVGTSSVIAKLGHRDGPYIYFDVRREEKYSETLDRHYVHTVLDTVYSYDGPTELGGLVVHPDYRGRPERFGTLISMARFLLIGMRRADFEDELLAELLPPFAQDGSSHLWEAVGRRFTGLSYREADQLSRRNKEFIRGLFPDSIYATLLDPAAQDAIGRVGKTTEAVERLLRRVGFEYAQRVDPFDGGPHFVAATDRVDPIARLGTAQLATDLPAAGGMPVLAGFDGVVAPYFRCRSARLASDEGAPVARREDLIGLCGDIDDEVAFVPLEPPVRSTADR